MNLEEELKNYKQHRIPVFMGSLFQIISSRMHGRISDDEFEKQLFDSYDSGYTKGVDYGVDSGIKNFIISGKNQVFVTKHGDVFPFGSMEEIYKNDVTKTYIKDFLKDIAIRKELPKLENELDGYMNDVRLHTENELNIIINRRDYIQKHEFDLIEIEKLEKKIEKKQNMRLEDYFNQLEGRKEKIINLSQKLDGELNFSKIKEANDAKLKKLSGKSIKSTSKSNDELQFRNKLKNNIDFYETLNQANITRKLMKNTKKSLIEEIDSLDNPTLTRYFKEHKPGESAIFKSDYFDIYTVDKLRKMINPKGKDHELEDIRDISKRIKDNFIDVNIYDKRSKPMKERKTMDYISFPAKNRTISQDVKLYLENTK
jgi:hypothetical protein